MTQAVNYQLAPLQGSSYAVACFEEIKYGAEKLPDKNLSHLGDGMLYSMLIKRVWKIKALGPLMLVGPYLSDEVKEA